jgi:hypothetical protein
VVQAAASEIAEPPVHQGDHRDRLGEDLGKTHPGLQGADPRKVHPDVGDVVQTV